MNEKIITAVASIIGTVLAAVVPLLIQNIALKRRLKEAPTIARGLAVGYFNNFLLPISSILNQVTLEVRFASEENRIPTRADSSERVRKFSSQEVEIILIVPKRLTAAAITHATDEVKLGLAEIRQAEILRPGAQRGFTVNYDLLERGGKTILVIRDLVKPYSAIKFYAEKYLNLRQDSAPWREMEQDTLSEFRQTIELLRNLGDGVGINQISWKEIE